MGLRSVGVWLLAILLAAAPCKSVRSNIKSVRFGTNILNKQGQTYFRSQGQFHKANDRYQGRLLHQGIKTVAAATSAATRSCKSAVWDDKVVIASRFDEDVSWMASYLHPDIPYLVYSISGDEDAIHRTASNTGREAHAYIQFVVDYYDCLPKYMAFIHAHRASAHSPDILSDLKSLQWEKLPGFVSLSRPSRYSVFHFHDPDFHKPEEGDETETAHWSQFAYEQNINIRAHWEELFQDEMGDLPEILRSPNCGQFAVRREDIYAHPKDFYLKQLTWMRSTSMDTFWAGLIYEHLWSYILGAGTNYTQPADCDILLCDSSGKIAVPTWE